MSRKIFQWRPRRKNRGFIKNYRYIRRLDESSTQKIRRGAGVLRVIKKDILPETVLAKKLLRK